MGKITRNDFIKIGNRYLLKNSNSVYVNEAEMQKIIIEEKRKDDKKVVTENEAEPITTDVVKKTVTTKK